MGKDKHMKLNDWTFYQFGRASSVISAERKVKNMEKEKINYLEQEFKKRGFKVCFEFCERSKVDRMVMQIYKIYDSDMTFKSKAGRLLNEITDLLPVFS